MKAVEDLGYQEVRGELKELGLQATGSNDVVRRRLSRAREVLSGTSAATAAQVPLNAEDSVKAPSHAAVTPTPVKRSQRRISSLAKSAQKQAMKGRVAAEEAVGAAEDAAMEPPAAVSNTVCNAWDSAKGAITPASRSVRRAARRTRVRTASAWQSVTDALPAWIPWQFLLGLLTGIMLVILLHPHAWHDARHWSSERGNNVILSTIQARDMMWRSWLDAFPRGRYAKDAEAGDGGCRAIWRQESLQAELLPNTPHWAPLVADIRSALVPHSAATTSVSRGHLGRASSPKATGFLLVAESAHAGAAAVAGLQHRMSDSPCAGCLLVITGEQLAQGGPNERGALQSAIVETLRKCPTAAVAVAAASDLARAPTALPVVINALSEGGHLTADGQHISTENLVFVVTMAAPPAVMASAVDEDDFKSAAKAHFVGLFADLNETVFNPHEMAKQKGYAEVLRRRLDFVAPMRHLSVPV